jgi:alanyl-tRNA synthetase
MKKLTSHQIREEFQKFFESKDHKRIPSASVVPENDPTALFTTAGMHPLVPYLMGQEHPQGRRLTNSQKSFRTDDIDEVGDNSHSTFFEMLGNWSLGDYWKEEAIFWSWEFLTKVLEVPEERLFVTIFEGDSDAPKDIESAEIWKKVGVPEARIFEYPKEKNWWGPVGESGPCGPDTEMFFDTIGGPLNDSHPNDDSGRFIEIWNDVFMQYERRAVGEGKDEHVDGHYEYLPLKQKNVDTGMGLERILTILQGAPSIYETDIYDQAIRKIGSWAKIENSDDRVIADHIRATLFLVSDGVIPSNIERGYILRRLIRRALKLARRWGFPNKLQELVDEFVPVYEKAYPEIVEGSKKAKEVIEDERVKFLTALEKGEDVFHKYTRDKDFLTGEEIFNLFTTYGLQPEITSELAEAKKIRVEKAELEKSEQMFKDHQEKSRSAGKGMFKGGLADHSEVVTRMHTATHLLHQALRDVLGSHVYQRGSNITPERLRFDFSHGEKMTEEQIKRVEEIVNSQIKADLPVHKRIVSLEEAQKIGAIGLFGEKYGETVSIYTMGDYSKEFCGGPHVEHTSLVGDFKILKEEALGSGLRRIKAVVS